VSAANANAPKPLFTLRRNERRGAEVAKWFYIFDELARSSETIVLALTAYSGIFNGEDIGMDSLVTRRQ
jgi:hypothetical protein